MAGVGLPRVSLSAQGCAAFGATACQNLTAILGGHAVTEPVTAFTNKTARLVGAFHDLGTLFKFLTFFSQFYGLRPCV
jgi:hypothetical protein